MKKMRKDKIGIHDRQLMNEARWGNASNVQALLDQGGDPLVQDESGFTALMKAAGNGMDDCVDLLLPLSDPLAQDNYGFTSLMWAVRYGYEDCVKTLLPHSDSLAQDHDGHSALMLAARYGHEDCARLLLDRGDVLPAWRKPSSKSFIHAAKRAHQAFLKLVLSSRGRWVNNSGQSASDIARDHGHRAVAELIDGRILAHSEASLMDDIAAAAPKRGVSKSRL